MKIGTHNSMSYLPPKKWYMYPFRFVAKCQETPIEKQILLGARMVDLRVAFNKEGVLEFRHGSMAYKGNVTEVLDYLNTLSKTIYVRLILENTKLTKNKEKQEEYFKRFCFFCETNYKKLKFFCGRRKFDWKLIYKFKLNDPDITQKISSMTWKKLDDWWPWLYAKIMNRKNIKAHNNKTWLLIDFINIK